MTELQQMQVRQRTELFEHLMKGRTNAEFIALVYKLMRLAQAGDWRGYRTLIPSDTPIHLVNRIFIDRAPKDWQMPRHRFGESWRYCEVSLRERV